MVAASPAPFYIAAAANRASNVSDCRSDGLVAFGSGRFVALWDSIDEDSRGVKSTLPGHKSDVSALKFLRREEGKRQTTFISGDKSGTARTWQEQDGQFTSVVTVTAHSMSVSAISSVLVAEHSWIIATGGTDGEVKLWRYIEEGEPSIELLQTIGLKGKMPLDLAFSRLPESESLVLAIGGTENMIRVYSSKASSIQFTPAIVLDGHADWVRCLDFVTPVPASSTAALQAGYDVNPGELLLASGSQDNYIRLWRFCRLAARKSGGKEPAPPSAGEGDAADLDKALAEFDDEGELRVKSHDFEVEGDSSYSCLSEAVLLGHEAWVTGLHWHAERTVDQVTLRLLSASADRSMILWEPIVNPGSSSLWTNTYRFGEFDSQTNLGFFGALWGKDGKSVLAHGWGGAWHTWRSTGTSWEPMIATTGHTDAAKSISWEPRGQFLLSAGFDMATRLHAPWRRKTPKGPRETWHELGRPQIHGYEIAKVAFTGRLQFVSGADEKILRVFDAPKVFLRTTKELSGLYDLGDEAERPMAANLPPLGLSNRAISSAAEAEPKSSKDPFQQGSNALNLEITSTPPLEEQLMGSMLWPEIDKLYGHGYELIALAAGNKSPVIATACKSTDTEHAAIRLYSTKTWKQVGIELRGHSLTVTNLAFSSDDRFLVSGSRDRTWHLWGRVEDGFDYRLVASSKSHARIIWDVCWAVDDSFFATASRDKTVKIWGPQGERWVSTAALQLPEAATALAATSTPSHHVLAVGCESGVIWVYVSPIAGVEDWRVVLTLDQSVAHVMTVNALRFRPTPDASPSQQHILASASDDRSVRLFDIST